MTVQLAAEAAPPDERMGIGGNNPPLAESLADETAADRARMLELVAGANAAVIKSPADQARVTTLAGLIGTHYTEVEAKRVLRKAPFDEGAKAVQAAYKQAILDPLDAAKTRLRTLNDDYEREQERLRNAERRRLAEEEERQRREAEDAARKAVEAVTQGRSGLAAELAAIEARDRADAAARAREAVRAAPVRTDMGTASQTTVRTFVIDDLMKVWRYLNKSHKAALIEQLQPLVDRLGRAKITIPGVLVQESKSTRFGR